MTYILRATRWLVALIISAHVSGLRANANLADRKAAKAGKRTEQARAGLRFAQDAVRYARINVREFRSAEAVAQAEARNCRVGCDAEARYLGREL
jgi:multidrug resistance efflux pump